MLDQDVGAVAQVVDGSPQDHGEAGGYPLPFGVIRGQEGGNRAHDAIGSDRNDGDDFPFDIDLHGKPPALLIDHPRRPCRKGTSVGPFQHRRVEDRAE